MWVFTNRGFYSVVQHEGDPSMLVVRARAEGDLIALREFIPRLEIVTLPNRDYEFRAYVERIEWEAALVELAEDIDYSNFKDSVTAKMGKARHDILLRIWSVALDIGRIGRIGRQARLRATQRPGQRQFDLPGERTLLDPWADPAYPSASGSKKSRKRANRRAARA